MPDSNETIFIGTMLRVNKLDGFRISPNCLGLMRNTELFLSGVRSRGGDLEWNQLSRQSTSLPKVPADWIRPAPQGTLQ